MTRKIVSFLIGIGSAFLCSFAGAVTYTYDDVSRLTSVTYDDGGKISYAYDATGNITAITRTPPGVGSTTAASTTTTTSTATTTTSAVTTTSTASTTTTTLAGGGATLNLASGWNLVGNGSDAPINVTTAFSDTNTFITVWKWIAAQSAWAFHAPSLAAQGGTALSDYVTSKGYQALTTIAGGEGFWVNAKQAGSINLTSGNPITAATLGPTLIPGWNLSGLGETVTPKQFCEASTTGAVTTLWAWDASNSAWYFYAPSLDSSGNLGSYITSKGYLDFTATGKTLGPGVGFWVNKP